MIKAIVTGHSRGLGSALAAELLAHGAQVLGLSRARHATLAQAHPAALTEVQLDLSASAALLTWLDSGELATWVAGARQVLLLNNAGLVQPVGPPGRQTPHDVAQAVALNVAAPLVLADAMVAATPACADRRVAHLSSGAARNPYPGWSIYCATKAALDMHARAVQLDAVPGLRVASVAPGVIDTDMQAHIRASAEVDFPLRARFEALKREGQLAPADNVAQRLVAYLLSEAFGNDPTPDIRTL